MLSDVGNKIARKFGVVFKLSKGLLDLYRTFGHAFEDANGASGKGELPVPGTFLIDPKGTIRLAHVDVHVDNYKTSGAELVMGTGRFIRAKTTIEARSADGGVRVLHGKRVVINIGNGDGLGHLNLRSSCAGRWRRPPEIVATVQLAAAQQASPWTEPPRLHRHRHFPEVGIALDPPDASDTSFLRNV